MGQRGPKKGAKYAKTIAKEEANKALAAIVLREMRDMTAAQISNAKGVKFLVVREKKTGKFLRVGKGRAERLDPEHEIIEIWEKDPSILAYTDLMNRTLGKPKDTVDVEVSGTVVLAGARLDAARQRARVRNLPTGEARQ